LLKLKLSAVGADFSKLTDFLMYNWPIFATITFAVGIPYYWCAIKFFQWRSKKHETDEFVTGSRFIPSEKIKKKLHKIETSIPLGELRVPADAETKHFFLCGRTGSGKTQVLKRALTHLKERGSKIILLDNKGDFVPSHYDSSRDLIFCPADQCSVRWSIFNDIKSFLDIEQVVCHSLIQNRRGSDPFWPIAARAVLKGILFYAWRTSRGTTVTNKALWDLLRSGSHNLSKILREIPEGAAGYEMITDPSSKQTQGIIANLLQDLAVMELMARQDGNFSIKEWLINPNPSTLYILNPAKARNILKPVITLIIDMISHEVLSMNEDHSRRIFFVLDEFGALYQIPSLLELLTRGRSKGASVWLATQDVGQIQVEYGTELTSTIVNNCGTKVILAISEPQTGLYLSDMIGEVEVREMAETHSMGLRDLRDGINLSRSTKTKKLVLPSELQVLHNLEAFVKFPNFDYTRTKIPYVHYVDRHVFFTLRKDMKLPPISVADGDSIYNIKAASPSSPFREF